MSNIAAQVRQSSATGSPTVLVALGAGLLGAAVAVSAVYSRAEGDLDLSNFTVGVLATAVLLGLALLARLRVAGAEERAALVSWPGAFGAVSVGLLLGVLVNRDQASVYAGAAVVLVLSVLGYWLVPKAPFVLAALAGAAALYVQGFTDAFDTGTGFMGDGNNSFLLIGCGIVVFVLVTTVAGWLLPATRVLTGVTVGIAGLAALLVTLYEVAFIRNLTYYYGLSDTFDDPSDPTFGESSDPFGNDLYVVLACCLFLALLWVVAALATGHVGFRLLLAADAIVAIPLATFGLHAEHPTWWGVVPAALGGVVLVLAGLQLRRRPAEPPVVPYGEPLP